LYGDDYDYDDLKKNKKMKNQTTYV